MAQEQKIAYWLRLPWSYQGPTRVGDDAEESYELRIKELPGFLVAGFTREEVLAELEPALTSFLESYLEHGETPPKPANLKLWNMFLFHAEPAPENLRPAIGAPWEHTRGADCETVFAGS